MRTLALSLFLAGAALSLAAACGSAHAQGQGNVTVEIESVEASAETPVEGDNITVTVILFNNLSVPVLLSNFTVGVFAAGADPEIIAELADVPLTASNRTTFEFHWVAKPGTRSITAAASVAFGNSSTPLPPASTTVLVGRAQIVDPGAVAGGIAALLAAVLVLAVLPAFIEKMRSGGPKKPGAVAAEGPDEGSPPVEPSDNPRP